MSRCGTYGDHITLQRAVEIFNVQFLIISTLGIDASSIISESNTYSESLPLLVLGHIAEGHGEHYLSLEGPVSSFIDNIVEAERERYGCESNQEDTEPDGSLNECHDATFDENHHHFLDVPNDCILDEPYHNPLHKPHDDALFEASDTLNECQDALFNVNHHHVLNKPDYCTLDQHHHDPLDIPHDDSHPYNDGNSEMPNLPTELLSHVIQLTLDADMSVFGIFNRVSKIFQDLTLQFLPQIFIRESFAESLQLEHDHDKVISIMRLYKLAGRGSGLSLRLKELFGKNSKWMRAWVVLRHVTNGHFTIKDIFWKK